jgi:antitoxin ParD1/3/4
MSTMNISLTPELDEFVRAKTASGEFTSSSEVVRAALRMMERDQATEAMKLEILRREVGVGIEQAQQKRFATRSVKQIAQAVLARRKAAAE